MKDLKILILVVMTPIILWIYFFIFYAFMLAPASSRGVVIGAAVVVKCYPVEEFIKDVSAPKDFFFDTLAVSQLMYELYISKAVTASDGGGLMPEIFKVYGEGGDKCDSVVFEMAEKYLSRGAKIDDLDKEDGRPATIYAIASINPSRINFLLKHGANICSMYTNKKGIKRNIFECSKGFYKFYGDSYMATYKVVEAAYKLKCSI